MNWFHKMSVLFMVVAWKTEITPLRRKQSSPSTWRSTSVFRRERDELEIGWRRWYLVRSSWVWDGQIESLRYLLWICSTTITNWISAILQPSTFIIS